MIGHGHRSCLWLWRWPGRRCCRPQYISVPLSIAWRGSPTWSLLPVLLSSINGSPTMTLICWKEIRQRVEGADGILSEAGGLSRMWISHAASPWSDKACMVSWLFRSCSTNGPRWLSIWIRSDIPEPSSDHCQTGHGQLLFQPSGSSWEDHPVRSFLRWESPDGSRVMTLSRSNSCSDNSVLLVRTWKAIVRCSAAADRKRSLAFWCGWSAGGPTKVFEECGGDSKGKGSKISYGSLDSYFEKDACRESSDHSRLERGLAASFSGFAILLRAVLKKAMPWQKRLWWKPRRSAQPANCGKRTIPSLNLPLPGETAVHAVPWQHGWNGSGFPLSRCRGRTWLCSEHCAWCRIYSHSEVGVADPTTDKEAQYLIAFNPHAWEVRAEIHYDISWNDQPRIQSVVDSGTSRCLIGGYWPNHNATAIGRFAVRSGTSSFWPEQVSLSLKARQPLLPPARLKGLNSKQVLQTYLLIRTGRSLSMINRWVRIFSRKAGEMPRSRDQWCSTWSHKIVNYEERDPELQ